MGKKNKERNIGRLLIKDRFGTSRCRRNNADFYLHSAELQDGYNWSQLNLESITEENSFQEFLSTADLVSAKFQAEKLNIKFVNSKNELSLLSNEEYQKMFDLQERNKVFLKIPRRPKWDKLTSAHELQAKEREAFLEWRKKLSILQEKEELILTPYEKNLEFWRQLWRVIERSDVIVQIVDARNPLLFRCQDLEQYVKELNSSKINIILINKSDFLTEKQREIWAEYFSKNKIQVAFFSATLAAESKEIIKDRSKLVNLDGDQQLIHSLNIIEDSTFKQVNATSQDNDLVNLEINNVLLCTENNKQLSDTETKNSSDLLTKEELIKLFKNITLEQGCINRIKTIGFVGYPNVGKSSTINTLLMNKKLSVSMTPGKTKHFQTLYLDENLLLCDCPGLVMPSFVYSKAEMVLNGILSINQMKDYISPITLLGILIPSYILEDLYGFMIPSPSEGENPNRAPSAEEILNAHAINRGFMTQNGQPDNSRSARCILKDFLSGKILYCTAPPGCSQSQFHTFSKSRKKLTSYVHLSSKTVKDQKCLKSPIENLDKTLIQSLSATVHVKGKNNNIFQTRSDSHSTPMTSSNDTDKPWKKINKHSNKKKKEKSRRIYAHLDKE